MSDEKSTLLGEAYRRGILPPDMKATYEEAQKRGLLGSPPAPGGREGSLADVASEAMTFGLTNDMAGLASAAGPAARFVGSFVGIPGVDYKPGEVSDAYSTGRNESVARNRKYREEAPWRSFAADLAGGIANPLMRLLPVGGANKAITAAKSAGAGAVAGGLYGAGTTEGNVWDRAEGAATGGIVGGAVGAVAPTVIDAGAKGVRYLVDQTIGRMGKTNQASVAGRKIMEALQRDGLTPDEAMARLQKLGPQAALLDVGPNSQALAASVARAPGKGKVNLEDFVTARQEGTRSPSNVLTGAQSQRVAEGIDSLIPDKVDDTLKAVQAQRARAGGNYERAKVDPVNNLVDIAPMVKSLDDEIASSKGSIRTGLERVRGLLVDKNSRPEVTIDALHQAKMAIDDLMSSGEGRNSIGRVGQQRIKDYQTQLLKAIETSGPAGAEYATGRGATAAAWRTQEALESGGSFMNRSEFPNPKELKAALAKMSPEDLDAFRMGAAGALKSKIADLPVRADSTKRIMDIPALESKIRLAFGDEDTFRRYVDMLKAERTMFDSYAGIKGNSRTAERLAADADLKNDPGAMADAVVGITSNPANPMNYLRAGVSALAKAKERFGTPEPVRDQIAAAMIGRDRALLDKALKAQGVSQARRDMLTRSLIGGGAVAGGYAAR